MQSTPELPLFQEAHARNSDHATSHAAAASVRKISATQSAILAILQVSAKTDELLISVYNSRAERHPDLYPKASPSGIRSRRAELVRLGYVKDSGRTAQISAGRQATVWSAV
jgi:hypothetical protein